MLASCLLGQHISPVNTNRGRDRGNVLACRAAMGTVTGCEQQSVVSVISSPARPTSRFPPMASLTGSPQSRVSETLPAAATTEGHGAQKARLSGGNSSVSSTAVAPPTLSVDGLLLFIGDTNIFPMLSFEVRGEASQPPVTTRSLCLLTMATPGGFHHFDAYVQAIPPSSQVSRAAYPKLFRSHVCRWVQAELMLHWPPWFIWY